MGKAAVIPERVEWIANGSESGNSCVGLFANDADRSFIIKELKSAPVDKENLDSRVALYKKRKSVETNPLAKGYSESGVIAYTNQELDDDDIKEVPYEYAGVQKKASFNGKSYKYAYSFKIETSGQLI